MIVEASKPRPLEIMGTRAQVSKHLLLKSQPLFHDPSVNTLFLTPATMSLKVLAPYSFLLYSHHFEKQLVTKNCHFLAV